MMESRRGEFGVPEGAHYLNCAYMSPIPRRVEEAGIEGIRRKRFPAAVTPADFFADADRARGLFARLVGAEAERVAIVPAVSYGMAIVARHLPLEAGRTIVLAGEQFPSNVYAWRAAAARTGATVRAVPAPTTARRGAEWSERLLEAIGPETALVAIGHVHWTDGTRFDVERIGERAREVGAAFVIDGTQSVGALPFDVRRVRPDALVCAAYKWLFGPYGVGFAWLGPRFDDAEPIEETWIGRRGSEDFRALVDYRDEYRPGAERFDVGERSNFVLLPMAIAALELVLEWRPERIQAYCAALTRGLIDEARGLGFAVEDEAWRGAHLFGLRAPPGLDIARGQAILERRRVHVSLRGSAIRVAPHVYNEPADIDALAAALREWVSDGGR